MINVITENGDGTTTIAVDFADEEIALTGQTSVKGGEVEALRYLPTYAADLRRNFADLFPQPEPDEEPPGGEL